MKTNLLKTLLILLALLFISTGVSWAGGSRGGHNQRHSLKGLRHGEVVCRKPVVAHYHKRYKKHPHRHRYRPEPRHYKRFHRPYPRHRHEHRVRYPSGYAIGFAIVEPGIAFAFGIKGH